MSCPPDGQSAKYTPIGGVAPLLHPELAPEPAEQRVRLVATDGVEPFDGDVVVVPGGRLLGPVVGTAGDAAVLEPHELDVRRRQFVVEFALDGGHGLMGERQADVLLEPRTRTAPRSP